MWQTFPYHHVIMLVCAILSFRTKSTYHFSQYTQKTSLKLSFLLWWKSSNSVFWYNFIEIQYAHTVIMYTHWHIILDCGYIDWKSWQTIHSMSQQELTLHYSLWWWLRVVDWFSIYLPLSLCKQNIFSLFIFRQRRPNIYTTWQTYM